MDPCHFSLPPPEARGSSICDTNLVAEDELMVARIVKDLAGLEIADRGLRVAGSQIDPPCHALTAYSRHGRPVRHLYQLSHADSAHPGAARRHRGVAAEAICGGLGAAGARAERRGGRPVGYGAAAGSRPRGAGGRAAHRAGRGVAARPAEGTVTAAGRSTHAGAFAAAPRARA